MPRSVAGDSFYTRSQGTHARVNYWLEIDAPSGMLTLSDTPRKGRPIILGIEPIAPMLTDDEGSPEAQSFAVRLSNAEFDGECISEVLYESGIQGVECRLYACDTGGSGSGTIHSRRIFRGVLQDPGVATEREVTIRIDGRGASFQRSLARLVRDTYPQAPAAHAGRLQPLVYGRVPEYPPVPVDVGICAELDEACSAGASSIVLSEDISHWPTSGTIQIGDASLVSYSGRTVATRTLTGLSWGVGDTPESDYPAGTVVMQRPLTFKFLVADRQYGPCKAVRKVRIAGVEIPSTRWSFDDATNILSITPFSGSSGRPTYNRVHLSNLGKFFRGSKPNSFGNRQMSPEPHGIRLSSDAINTRPVTNCAHNNLTPARASSSDYFWNVITDTTPPADDKHLGTSTVKLNCNAPKTWPASAFASALPPGAMFTRTGVSVALSVTPAMRRTRVAAGTFTLKPSPVRLKRIDVTVNGVTKSWQPSGDDLFSAPRWTLSSTTASTREADSPVQDVLLQWTAAEAPPENAPYAVTAEAVTDPADSGHACRVRTLVQSVDGVMPWSAVTSVQKAALSTENPAAEVELTFDEAPQYAILAVAARVLCDYIRVDLGNGQVARFAPHSLEDNFFKDQGDLSSVGGGYSTFTVLVANPGTTIKIQARDFGNDTGLPAAGNLGTGSGYVLVCDATLTGVSAGSAAFPLLKPVKAESVFLAMFGAYPTIDAEGYCDWGVTGSGIPWTGELFEHPPDVVHHYISQVMGEPEADVNVRANSADWSSTYKFAGVIDTQEDIRLPLVRMARESRAWIHWDSFTGKWEMLFRPSASSIVASDHAWTPADWLQGDIAVSPTTDADLVQKVVLRYARNWTLGRDLESYQLAAVGATTTGDKTADERYVCDFVRTAAHAQLLADFHSEWDTAATRRIGVNALIKHYDVTKGDAVSVSIPIAGTNPTRYLQGIQATRFLVLAVGWTPGDLNSNLPDHVPVILQEVP